MSLGPCKIHPSVHAHASSHCLDVHAESSDAPKAFRSADLVRPGILQLGCLCRSDAADSRPSFRHHHPFITITGSLASVIALISTHRGALEGTSITKTLGTGTEIQPSPSPAPASITCAKRNREMNTLLLIRIALTARYRRLRQEFGKELRYLSKRCPSQPDRAFHDLPQPRSPSLPCAGARAPRAQLQKPMKRRHSPANRRSCVGGAIAALIKASPLVVIASVTAQQKLLCRAA